MDTEFILIKKVKFQKMTFCLKKLAFVILTFLTGCATQETTKCVSLKLKSSKLPTELTESQATVEYNCPREFDPKTFTECCNNDGCCESSFLSMAVNDEWLLMVTAILVICSCTFLTIMVVVCCFWSKCPLYSACRANYNTSNVIVYSLGKDDPTPLMPAEANRGGQYHPCTVKIRKMQDV